jgi:uncharacterized membrane protein
MKQFVILLADKITDFIGSWKFILLQTAILTFWILLNALQVVNFDQYPFIFLNFFLLFVASYTTPLILISMNRSSEKDRKHILRDFQLDQEIGVILKDMSKVLNKVSEDMVLNKKTNKDLNIVQEQQNKIKNDLNITKQLVIQLTKKIP